MTRRLSMARNRLVVYVVGVCLIGIFGLGTSRAQTVTGSITGQVTDPSGALVSGATVTAENVATSVKTTATTNSAGLYTIPFLPISSYTLTVDFKGFASAKIAPFALEINQTANIPLNGRNFSSLTLYQPGAVATDPTGLTGNNAIERNTFNNGVVTIND